MKRPINVFVAMLRSGRRLVEKFLPPRQWTVPVILTAGTFCGLGMAHVTAYVLPDPLTGYSATFVARPESADSYRRASSTMPTTSSFSVGKAEYLYGTLGLGLHRARYGKADSAVKSHGSPVGETKQSKELKPME
jgi:hypothetical protein